ATRWSSSIVSTTPQKAGQMRQKLRTSRAVVTVVTLTPSGCRGGQLGQRSPDAAHRLSDPVLVLHEREADVALAVGAEAAARADGDLRLAQQPHRELLRAL